MCGKLKGRVHIQTVESPPSRPYQCVENGHVHTQCVKCSYEELARTLFGRIGGQAVNVCIVTLNVTCMVAYISILADVLSSVAGSVIPPGAEPSRNVLMAGKCD